jgi:heme exporter protein B
VLTLLLGTPVLSLFGAIGVALTVGLGSRGLILAVIVLPLTVPVLIIGAKAVTDASLGLPLGMHYALLGALLALSLSLAPLASAAALKISVN